MKNKIENVARNGLNKVSKFTGTDFTYIAKGSFWLTSSKVITAIASLTTSIFFANMLSEHDYGVYRYVLSFVSIFTIATLSGIDTALVRQMGKGFDGNYRSLLYTKIKWGLLGGLLSLCFSIYYFIKGNNELSISFLIVSMFIPLMDSFYIYMSYLNGIKRYDLYNKYHLWIKVIVVLSLLTTIFITTNILIIIFVYFFVHTLIRGLFAFHIIWKNKFKKEEPDKEILSFGKHLTLMKVLGIISTSIDKILVFHFLGSVALAGYYIALVPFKQLQGVFGSLNILALPKFSSNEDHNSIRKTLPKKVLKSYLIIIPAILIYFLFAEFAFELIYPKYTDYINLSKIFMLLLLFFPLTLFNTALTAMAKTKSLYFLSTLSAVIRIILLLALVPAFGLWGAIFAVIITHAISGLSNTFIFLRNN